jgi:hypothetical protein
MSDATGPLAKTDGGSHQTKLFNMSLNVSVRVKPRRVPCAFPPEPLLYIRSSKPRNESKDVSQDVMCKRALDGIRREE